MISILSRAPLEEGRRPKRLRTDKGQEFRSREFNGLLTDREIDHLYVQNTEIKANYAERVIKTTKSKIYRYLTYQMSELYIDRLQDFAGNYYSTYHTTTGMAPAKVSKSKETNLWWKMYWPKSVKRNLRKRLRRSENRSVLKLGIKSD